MRRHTLDINPVLADKDVLYINEPWLIDDSLVGTVPECNEPEAVDVIGEIIDKFEERLDKGLMHFIKVH